VLIWRAPRTADVYAPAPRAVNPHVSASAAARGFLPRAAAAALQFLRRSQVIVIPTASAGTPDAIEHARRTQ